MARSERCCAKLLVWIDQARFRASSVIAKTVGLQDHLKTAPMLRYICLAVGRVVIRSIRSWRSDGLSSLTSRFSMKRSRLLFANQ